jgi:hypothetical protein
MVGLAGLEPATFRPPDGRATRLRHSPRPDPTNYRNHTQEQEENAGPTRDLLTR